MPERITYSIQCYPAEITPPGPGTFASCIFQMFDPKMTRHTISAEFLVVLQARVREIARESGQDACIMISLPRGQRKPRGFDAACEQVRWIKYEESSNAQ